MMRRLFVRLRSVSPSGSRSRSHRLVEVDALETRIVMSAAFELTGLTDMRLDPAFPGVDGSGVTVAVLDSGIFATHPQLRDNVVAFYNAVSARLPATVDASSLQFARDEEGHGTHVAGTVASSDPEIGVAPAAHVVSVKVIPDVGEAQIGGDPLLRGLQFVERFADQFNIKVVNMSLGLVTQSGGLNLNEVPDPDDISRAIDTLESMGITVVTSSGNSYANDPTPGASYPAVSSTISVGSTWSDTGVGHDFSAISGGSGLDQYFAFEDSGAADRFSATSQRSTLPNQLVAPGVDIYSTWNGTSGSPGGDLLHNTISGTSMAAPFVSGLVALMQDAAFTIGGKYIEDVGDVFDILSRTADVFTDANVADNGRYRIDDNGFLDPTPLNLPETGRTFRRVNVLRAMEGVRSFVTTGSIGGPGGDTDSRTAFATNLPAITAARGVVRRGNIGTDGSFVIGPNDVDLFRVTLTGPGDIGVSLSLPAGGTAFTPSLRLFNGAGQQIARADAAGGAYPFLRTDPAAPLAAGTYYVGVSSLANVSYSISNGAGATGGQSQGDYSLGIATNNPDADGVTGGAISVDLTLPDTLIFSSIITNKYEGVIGADPAPASAGGRVTVPSGDVDMFRVVAPDDGVLRARAFGPSVYGPAGADTFVRILDANLVQLGANDNAAPGTVDSQLDVPVSVGKTYYVAVTNLTNSSFDPVNPYDRVPNSTPGDELYNLYLSFFNGDTNGTVRDAAEGAIGTAVSETIGADGGTPLTGASAGFKDVDFVAYTAGADGLLDLTATGAAGFHPSLAMWEYDFAQNTVVKIGEASGGATARLISQVPAGQRVYVSVTGNGNQNFNWSARASGTGGETGAYTLNSALRPTGDLRALSDGSIQNNTPTDLAANTPVLGSIGFDGNLVVDADVDLYKFVPAAGGKFDLRTDTSQEGSADTMLRLFDASGNLIATNDNATSRTNGSLLRVSLAAGQTYYVGVSGAAAGAPVYDAVSGAAAPEGSRGAYGLTVAPATGPAVSVSDAGAVAENYRGGSAATFTISLDGPAAGAVTVGYSTSDGTATGGADYTATTGSVTFAPGETSKTVTVPVAADSVNEGDEPFFLNAAVLDGTNVGVADDRGAAIIQNQQVLSIGFNGSTRATYTDVDGTRVVISLRGPGGGEVLLLGDARREAVGLTLTGTTGASSLSIKGATSVGDVTIAGALKGFGGALLDLAGNVNASGPLGRVQVHGMADGHAVAAPAVGALTVRGDFSGDVNVGTLGTLTVAGTLLNADVRSAGAIGAVKAGAARGSKVFAGVRAEIVDLPDALDDFANPAATIRSVTIKGRTGGTFADTLISAPSIGKVVLGVPQTANGGRPFGIAADVLKSVTAGAVRLINLSMPEQSKTDGDFALRIL